MAVEKFIVNRVGVLAVALVRKLGEEVYGISSVNFLDWRRLPVFRATPVQVVLRGRRNVSINFAELITDRISRYLLSA